MTATESTQSSEPKTTFTRGDLIETLIDGRLLMGRAFKKGSRGTVMDEIDGRVWVQFDDVALSVRRYRPENLKLVASAETHKARSER